MKDKIMDDEYIDNYDFKNIEQKWQSKWNKNKLYEADPDHREKYFINFPFPYINGSPHLGHGYSLMKAEVMARYQKMLGKMYYSHLGSMLLVNQSLGRPN